jgi:hypothetical protein
VYLRQVLCCQFGLVYPRVDLRVYRNYGVTNMAAKTRAAARGLDRAAESWNRCAAKHSNAESEVDWAVTVCLTNAFDQPGGL